MNLSLILFTIGILGFVLNRKNIILMLISIEIMLWATYDINYINPGLASLYTIRPQWFERHGHTRVTTLLEHMASDPSF
jgi:NADH:ubiquinone oxidoreductase subunit K